MWIECRTLVLCLVVVVFGARGSEAAAVVLSPLQDTTIFQNNVNNSSGAAAGLFAGTNGAGSPRRALIAFDIAAAVPAGATIETAELRMTLGQVAGTGGGGGGGGGVENIGLHRLSASWGEGTALKQTPPNDSFAGIAQGAAASEGDATWNARMYSATSPSNWAAPGGDFSSVPSAIAPVASTVGVEYAWSSPACTADVQSWLTNPAGNFGWLIKNVDEATVSNFRGFYSGEAATTVFHPKLVVTYSNAQSTADFDDDGDTDGADFLVWQRGLGSPDAARFTGDADGNGVVDGDDLAIWRQDFAASPTTPVPESTSIVVLLAAICRLLPQRSSTTRRA